ncbi:MAG: RrF2 family transcriptional regulator [Eubacteriales bacterium]|nr:RrF2 family transcriptional regulator [Eubacteriales bacterium]
MRISTKGRYALRILADLAEHDNGTFIPLKQIAERQEISEKYLEGIIVVFSKAGYLEGQRGKKGGYRFLRSPELITVWDVLNMIEGDMAPVECIGDHPTQCPRMSSCKTYEMWRGFYDMTKRYFKGFTIADLANSPASGDDYMI